MENAEKKCSFFGHRKIKVTNKLQSNLEREIETLIVEKDVSVFLFGSRSEFDDLCYKTVTNLQEKYPFIRRVAHPCKSEYAYLKGAQDKEKTKKSLENTVFLYQEYEEIKRFKRLENAGKASYMERNMEMLSASDFIIFYYDEQYQPSVKKPNDSKKSGTRIIYEYAVQKKKPIINLFGL